MTLDSDVSATSVQDLIKQNAPLETIKQACYDGMRMCNYSSHTVVDGVIPVEISLAVTAASMERIDVLNWLPRATTAGGVSFIIDAAVPHINVLKWIKKQGYLSYDGIRWDIKRWRAIRKGDIDFLQWIDDEGINLVPYSSFCKEEYAERHYCESHYHKWRTCKEALLKKQSLVIEWALENGYTWGNCTCETVIHEMLHSWIKGAKNAVNKAWDWKQILEWARKYGCPWDKEKCIKAASDFDHTSMCEWLMSLDP